MIEVSIKGFQSVEDVSFSIDGFTALVGRSNIGKSAVVRAVQSALTNASGTDFVRHGSWCSRRTRSTKKCRCQCSVHLKTEGFDLLWEKGDEVNRYTYNDQVYSRVDRGLPDFLTADFAPVKLGDAKRLVQVADQFSPIFLLNQSGLVVADVLSDVAKLDDIHTAMSEVDSDRREAASTLRVREKDIVGLGEALEAFAGLDAPVGKARLLAAGYEALTDLERKLESLDGFLQRLLDLAPVVRALQPVEAIVPPDPEPLLASETRFGAVLGYEAALAEQTASVGFLEPVEGILDLEADPLRVGEQALDTLGQWEAQIESFRASLLAWKELEAKSEPSDEALGVVLAWLQTSTLFDQHEVLSAEAARLEGLDLLPDLTAPEVEHLLTLASLADKHEHLAEVLDVLTQDLGVVESQEQACQADWSALGMCPTCSQSISEGHVLHLDA